MKLVIDRSKWLRGKPGDGVLLNEQGHMCCLGFFGLSCGLDRNDIFFHSMPSITESDKWPAWLCKKSDDGAGWIDSGVAEMLADFNDKRDFNEAVREGRIAETFARHGVEVEFIDGEQP